MAKMRNLLGEVASRTGTQDSRNVNISIRDILVGDITIKENVRTDYNDIEGLKESIRQHGLIQPVTVYREGGVYILKTGHRRYMAYQLLYKEAPDQFHSLRCLISNADNIIIVQLIENVQREDLSPIDLYNALSVLRDQGMTLKQIADLMGKDEGYIKKTFVGVNEISRDAELKNAIGYAGVTIEDIIETKGIPDKEARLDLLGQRGKGKINRAELRKKTKALKEDCPAKKETPVVFTMPKIVPSQTCSAAAIAKERLDQYILDKVEDTWDDLALWEFYTWLLEQSKHHAVNRSGFVSEEYKSDKEQVERTA
jgi:ParB family chromosome partitioning protein